MIKAEYFKKALCGEFRESGAQAISLPEEDPAIFHFLVAFLYEGRYQSIKSVASVLGKWDGALVRRKIFMSGLDQEAAKGKGKDAGAGARGDGSDSDGSSSSASMISNDSVRSRRRHLRRQRREARHLERLREKHPGFHRPECRCPQCLARSGPPCWACGAPRSVAPRLLPPGSRPPGRRPGAAHGVHHIHVQALPPQGVLPPPPPETGSDRRGGHASDDANSERIRGEDMRTWLLAYELSVDVYICANKFLMDDCKAAVARECIDMLETAGADAAQPRVLQLCRKLYGGLSEADPLLKMIFARVGFLQPLMWRRFGEVTSDFLVGNPEVGALILRETAARREEDFVGQVLPSMERGWSRTPAEALRLQGLSRF